ncbi:MAG: carbohydrate ABC transporter permease, partial [Trebonia sp.]
WTQGDFGTELINSLIYAVIPDALTLLLGVFLAFPISRGYFRFSNALYAFFVFSGFLPGALIPLFIEARALHLYDSRIGYLVLTSFAGAGFFFFVGYIKSIPREIDEAAALEGCGYFRFIFKIIIPQMGPALAAFGVFGFVASWNNLILPLVMLADQGLWPVTRGLYGFLSQYTTQWPLIAAATVIVAAPVLIVFILLQRHLVEGVAGGAVAGAQPIAQTGQPAAE